MKDKLYDPATSNEKSPVEGMAAVNTHTPEEKFIGELTAHQQKTENKKEDKQNDEGRNST